MILKLPTPPPGWRLALIERALAKSERDEDGCPKAPGRRCHYVGYPPERAACVRCGRPKGEG